MCLLGLFTFVLIAWLISENRRRFPWRVVIGGLGLQLALALFVLRTSVGVDLFDAIGRGFERVMGTVSAGTGFLFTAGEDTSLLTTFAFGVLPTVIFFSALMSILYHLGIMQKVVGALAVVMRATLGTSGVETLAASANVFVGHTEAPLVVRPYLATMTRSELCAMMVGGFATVTGGLLGVYAGMGIDISHLLTASVISAPAGLLIAKVMVPDKEEAAIASNAMQPQAASQPQTDSQPAVISSAVPNNNLIGAAVEGASDGLKLALNVGAMLIAFLALIALIDVIFASVSELLSYLLDRSVPVLTLGTILGYLGAPLAFLMGVPVAECIEAGRLIGLKTVANEFIAYAELGKISSAAKGGDSSVLSERTITVLTYALAGFSNFGAIGIQVGGIGGLEPSRRAELAELGLKAMFGGTLACCMTGAIAGLLL
jgi:CNT family concentrative nucleoside transporter